MQQLGASWDVVGVVRCLVTEVDALQQIVAGLAARVQVLEAKTEAKVAERFGEAEAKPKRAVSAAQSLGSTGAEG